MTNERDRNREEQLERLFRVAGTEFLPVLTPDPGLPTRIRALAVAEGAEPAWRRWTTRWAWMPLAGATVAVCVLFGAYLGYRVAQDMAPGRAVDGAELITAAWSQTGSAEDLNALDYGDEVME
jgi:hypothetical protein